MPSSKIVVETQDGGMGNRVTAWHFKEKLSDAKALGVDTSKTRLNDREIVYSPDRRVMAFSLERLFRDADGVTPATLRDPLVSKNYPEMTLVVHAMGAGLRLPMVKELESMGHLVRGLVFWTRERWFGGAGGGGLVDYFPGFYDGCFGVILGVACVGGAQDSK